MANTGKSSGGGSRGEHQGTSTGQHAQQAASSAVQKTQETASSLAEQARGTAQDVMHRAGEAASSFGQRAGETVTGLGSQMQHLAGTIRENAPREGFVGSAAGTMADTLETGGRYLHEHDLSGMADDLAGVVRRYPLQAVLAGIGIGFLMARVTRS
jgi:hypothetical protein